MEGWELGILLKPFLALVVFGLVALPIRLAVQRWMPESKTKRALLRHVVGSRRP